MNKKKLLALLMALVMTLSLVPVTAFAGENDALEKLQAGYEWIEANRDDIMAVDYTTAAIMELPAATISTLTDDQCPEDVDSASFAGAKLKATPNDAADVFWGKWETEIVMTNNKVIPAGTLIPMGHYEAYSVMTNIDWVSLDQMGEIPADTVIRVIQAALPTDFKGTFAGAVGKTANELLGLPYAAVSHIVEEFDCGVRVTDLSKIQPGTTLTMQLRLYAPDELNDETVVRFKEAGINLVYDEEVSRYYAVAPADTGANSVVFELPYAVAQIGEGDNATLYKTLADAINAAENGDTVKLLQNVTNGGGVQVSGTGNRTIIIDLDGHTYTVFNKAVGSTGTETQGFQFLKGSDITIENGTINLDESAYENGVKRLFNVYCNLTLDNVTVDVSKLPQDYQDYAVNFTNGDSSFINGTKVIADEGTYPVSVAWWPDGSYTDGAHLNVGTGTEVEGIYFACFDPPYAPSGENATAAGWKSTLTMDGSVERIGADGMDSMQEKDAILHDKITSADASAALPAGYEWKQEGDVYRINKTAYVAQIGTTEYPTLESAVEAAQNDDTITLLADISLDKMVTIGGKTLTLDLKGHNIMPSKAVHMFLLKDNAVVTVTDSVGGGVIEQNQYKNCFNVMDATLNVNAGKILASKDTSTYCIGILVSGSSNVTVSGSAVVEATGKAYAIKHNSTGTLTVDGNATVIGGEYGIYNQIGGTVTVADNAEISGDTAIHNNYNGTIQVKGSASVSGGNYGIFNAKGSGTVAVSGGAVSGGETGLGTNTGGNVTVSGGSITGTTNGVYLKYSTKFTLSDDGAISGGVNGLMADNPTSIEITVTGGSVAGDLSINKELQSDVTITINDDGTHTISYGGTKPGSITIAISGGIFSSEPDADYIATGYQAIANPNAATNVEYPYTVGKVQVTEKTDATVTVTVDKQVDVTGNSVPQVVKDNSDLKASIQTNTSVSGVALTNNLVGGTNGLQDVVNAAEVKKPELTAALTNAATVDVKVDVTVVPTEYTENKTFTFSLTPTATVTTKDENGATTATVSGVEVDNTMIDQTQDIEVTLYTGFKPALLTHRNNQGKVIGSYTYTEGKTASDSTFTYDDATGTCKLIIHHFSTIEATASSGAASVDCGGSLRRRVLANDRNYVVDYETDFRMAFGFDLPANAEVDLENSCFYWSTSNENPTSSDRTVSMRSYSTVNTPIGSHEYDNWAALIITGVPKASFKTTIYCKLHLAYKLEGKNYAVEITKGKSVEEIATGLAALEEDTSNREWIEYGKYLLGTRQVQGYLISEFE